jgi:hypothetical protein
VLLIGGHEYSSIAATPTSLESLLIYTITELGVSAFNMSTIS